MQLQSRIDRGACPRPRARAGRRSNLRLPAAVRRARYRPFSYGWVGTGVVITVDPETVAHPFAPGPLEQSHQFCEASTVVLPVETTMPVPCTSKLLGCAAICQFLECQPGDLLEHEPAEKRSAIRKIG